MKKTIANRKEKQAEWYKKNRNKVIERVKKRYVERKDEITSYKLKRSYGITLDKYNELYKEQKGLCAICEKKETLVDRRTGKIRKLAVDHCHKTGKVRGLLCRNCNMLLGCLSDSVTFINKILDYLSK